MRITLSFKYVITITLILLVVMGLAFWFILYKYEQMVTAELNIQARALFKQIMITRQWVAEQGGVFVEKLPWAGRNPSFPGAAITSANGRNYVKQDPATVTKQLSRYAEREQLFVFHITSLKLVNKENAPDAFEASALRSFEASRAAEASGIDRIGKSYYYRYIAPLYVEKSCLECHGNMGYKIGDVRGAISVLIPMDYSLAMVAVERRYLIAGAAFIVIMLAVTLYLVTRRIVITPIRHIQEQMALFPRTGKPDDIRPVATGDEIEDLNKVFVAMAQSVHEYQSCLEERVDAATRELVQANESLKQRNRQKTDYIAKLSHELRSPLTAIKGAMDYLSVRLPQHQPDDAQDLVVFFEVIKKNADRLIRLVNSALDYERIELGKFEMNFQRVNLKKAFQDVITAFVPLAEEKKVAIRLKAMELTASVDEDRIKQVLTNLISNALNFSAAGTSILVSLDSRDEYVHAAVEDQGSGVPESERDMLFQQFYTKDVKDGTGLGLAICKGIIEAHDGAIGVETGREGGSRFWFTLIKDRNDAEPDEKETACH